MKRLSIILTLLSALCLFGYDLLVYPTLMVNLTDQIKFVMPFHFGNCRYLQSPVRHDEFDLIGQIHHQGGIDQQIIAKEA